MKIIHKYVLREHLGPLLFAASALTSLMLLNYIAKRLGDLVGKGLPWQVIAEFFVLSIPFTVAMTLPMAVLVAVLHAFSRLASENEITALKANGVSMRWLMLPILGCGVVFSIGMILFNDRILPLTNHRLRALQGDIARKKPAFAIREQIINEVAPQEFFLRTNHLNPATNHMRDVTIYDLSDPLRRHTIYADSGIMAFAENGQDLKLTLWDGFIQEVPRDEPQKMQRLFFQVNEIRVRSVINAFMRDSSDKYKSDREMSICELQKEVASYEHEFFRQRNRYQNAAAVARKDPNAQVQAMPVSPIIGQGAPARARVASLGRSYCDAVAVIDTVTIPWVRERFSKVALALTPTVAFASEASQQQQQQQPPPAKDVQTPRQQREKEVSKPATAAAVPSIARQIDSARLRAVTDSVRKAAGLADSLAQRADSVVRVDTVRPTPPPVSADSQARLDSIAQAAMVIPGIPPSAGYGPAVPASVEMEAARNEMIRFRAQINQFAVEIHKKFAISVACTVFVLLGAPLALRFPRGGVGLVIGVSLIVFALYYVGLIAGESLSDRNLLPPSLSMWAANIVFTLVGLVLLARMERDGGTSRGSDASELWSALRSFGRRLTFRKDPA